MQIERFSGEIKEDLIMFVGISKDITLKLQVRQIVIIRQL